MNFNLQLVTSRPIAARILERAQVEKVKIEKILGSSIIKTYNSNRSQENRQEDKAEWESGLAKAINDVNTLPEGKAKEKAKLDQAEFQWRLGKMALDDDGEDPEVSVWAQLDKSVALVTLPIIDQLITEVTAHQGTLPA